MYKILSYLSNLVIGRSTTANTTLCGWAPITNMVKRDYYSFPYTGLYTEIGLLAYTMISSIPLEDQCPTISNTEYIRTNQHPGMVIPPEYLTVSEIDDYFKYNGGIFLEYSNDTRYTYMVNFSWVEKYPVRYPYYKYGGIAYFDENTDIKMIMYQDYEYEQTHPLFGLIKAILGSTTFVIMAFYIHAAQIHLKQAIDFGLLFRYSNINDKVTDLLNLMSSNVFKVGEGLPFLLEPGGIASKMLSFTNEGYYSFYYDMLHQMTWSKKEYIGKVDCVWSRKIKQYRDSVVKLFTELSIPNVIILGNDRITFAQLVDNFVMTTALHNQFGDVYNPAFYLSNVFLPKRYICNPTKLTYDDETIKYILQILIRDRAPYLNDPEVLNFFRDCRHKQAWKEWVISLKEIREFWFDTDYFEISTSY